MTAATTKSYWHTRRSVGHGRVANAGEKEREKERESEMVVLPIANVW